MRSVNLMHIFVHVHQGIKQFEMEEDNMAEECITKELTLLNKYGMHVRPAGLFAKIASRFNAEVEVEKDGNIVSGKSIMALMTLEAVCGTVLRVTARGEQAAEAIEELEALVGRKFDIPDEQ